MTDQVALIEHADNGDARQEERLKASPGYMLFYNSTRQISIMTFLLHVTQCSKSVCSYLATSMHKAHTHAHNIALPAELADHCYNTFTQLGL